MPIARYALCVMYYTIYGGKIVHEKLKKRQISLLLKPARQGIIKT